MGDKQNLAKESQLALKQDKLIAGANITIALDGKTISAANPTSVTVTPVYQAGTLVAAIVVNGNTTNIYAPAQHGDNANQNLAVPFNTSQTYEVGDFVIYQENLYQCVTAISTPAAWDSTKWTRALITDVMGQGGGGLNLPDNWSLDEEALTVMALDNDLNELGWKVENDTYYFDTAASFSLGDRTYTKDNAKPALGGVIGQPNGSGNRSIVLVSTVADATYFSWNNTAYSFSYNNKTWYYCGGNYAYYGSPASGIGVIPDDTLTLEQAAKYLIDYSQVSFTDDRFTTMNQPGSGTLFAGGGKKSDLSDATFKVTSDGGVYGTEFYKNGVPIGGGGSSVIPNPQDPATDTLTKIGINGTVYDIAGGGGGFGYTETTLWSGSETPSTAGTDINLSGNISDYDMIAIHVGNSYYTGDNIFLASDLTIGETYISTIYHGENLGAYFTYTSDAQINIKAQGSSYPQTYTKVIGIKYGSGGSGVSEQQILYIASSMTESEINVDMTAYDEYIIFANDVLVSMQIPQGNSFPKTVIQKAITDGTNILCYGYSDYACAYSVTANKLTYQSGRTQRIVMIVGIKFGGGGGGNVDDVYVNGESVLDANKIAQIKSYKEVTQTQYDALTPAQQMDGTMYLIKDGGGSGSGSNTYYGTTEPSSTLGENGDTYVLYDDINKIITAIYIKIEGDWLQTPTGGSSGGSHISRKIITEGTSVTSNITITGEVNS